MSLDVKQKVNGFPTAESATLRSADGTDDIENAVLHVNNAVHQKSSQISGDGSSSSSLASPLQPKRMNILNNNSNIINAEVNKLSVSFAADTTTLSAMLSDDDDNEGSDERVPSTTRNATGRHSILDTDDDLGKPYRSKRQRKSVGYYKWMLSNSPNDFVDENGNPRNGLNDDAKDSSLDDSMETKSSTDYEEEESEYVFDEDLTELDFEQQATHDDVNSVKAFQPSAEESTTMLHAHQTSLPPSASVSTTATIVIAASQPTALEASSSQGEKVPQESASSTATILSEEVDKNKVVPPTPLRRSPRKRRSYMPEEQCDAIQVASFSIPAVQEQPFKDGVVAESFQEMTTQGPTEPTTTQASSPGRILADPVGKAQRVITTPLRRSPRKKQKGIQRDRDAFCPLPCVAEPPQSPLARESNDGKQRLFIAEQPASPEPNATSTVSKHVPNGQTALASEILSQSVGNFPTVVRTPVRRSPRKKPPSQEGEATSNMDSIADQALSFPVTNGSSYPPNSPSTEATPIKSDKISWNNEVLSQQVEKNHPVNATPLRRSPRKRDRGSDSAAFMASIEQELLSPITKVSSPLVERTSARRAKVSAEMATVTETLSNATIRSPLDQEMSTPVTQSPFSSPPQAKPSAQKTQPLRKSPRKSPIMESNDPESVFSPFATVQLSPIQREFSSPAGRPAAAFESPKAHFLCPSVPCQHTSELPNSMEPEPSSTSLLSQFSQQQEVEEPVTKESCSVMNIDENLEPNGIIVTSKTAGDEIDQPSVPCGRHEDKNELEDPFDKPSNCFVLEYSLQPEQAAAALDESIVRSSKTTSPNCYKVRIVYGQSPAPPPKSILRTKLRYTKSDCDQVQVETDTTVIKEYEPTDEESSDDASSHGISLSELKHRMAILFPSDYSQLIHSSCDAARLFACFTLYKDAIFVQNESMKQSEQQPTKTAARARTRRRRLSLESKTPGINYLNPIMPFLNELVKLELVQYQSMEMAKQAKGAECSGSSSQPEEGSHRVHFPAFDGSALQPPSDVIEGSDRVREECIEQLSKVVELSRSLFGHRANLDDQTSGTKTEVGSTRRIALGVLQNLVQYLHVDFVTHGHSAPCSMSFPFKSHLGSRVERAAQSYSHDLSQILRIASEGETLECLTFANSSPDVSIVNRISSSSRCGPWECRLADNAGQQIRYWLRTLLNPIPDRAPPKSASNSAKSKQWRCRICDIVALCVEDAEQSMAVEDGSMSSLVSDALSFLQALFGVSTWQDFVSDAESAGTIETRETHSNERRQLPDAFFSSTISLRQKTIYPHQWSTLEEEMIAATEFLAAMNGVRFLHELFSILIKEPKYHKVWQKTIQDSATKLALVDESCIQSEDVQLLLLRTPVEEILEVLEKISQQYSPKYIQCQNQLKEFSERFAFGKKSKRTKRHQPDLNDLETVYEQTMEKINFPRAMRL